jgi:hypothetical protein
MREQTIALEHHVGRASLRTERRDIFSGDLDRAGGWFDEAADHAQKRCLAAAGRPKDREEIAAMDLQIDRLDRGRPAKALRDIPQTKKRVHQNPRS